MKGLKIVSTEELIIDLDGQHCIETTASRIHRVLMGRYLEGAIEGHTAERALDTLARFLAEMDFRLIRANHPELAGGYSARVRIFRNDSGDVLWEKVS